MAYELSWHEQNNVLFAKITDEYNFDDINRMRDELDKQYFQHATNPIHLIADIQNMTAFPKNLAHIRDASSHTLHHPRLGWLILVGNGRPFLKFFIEALFQLLQREYRVVTTLEEADELLTRIRQVESS